MYRKHQGHMIYVCTVKRRDEEHKKRKEMEAGKKNKSKGEAGNKDQTDYDQSNVQLKDEMPPPSTTQHINQKEHDSQHEDQWLTQRRKQPKNQTAPQQNKTTRPISLQRKSDTHHQNSRLLQEGITNLPTHNTYVDLEIKYQPSNKDVEIINTKRRLVRM